MSVRRRRLAVAGALSAVGIAAIALWIATPGSLVTGVRARQRERIDRLAEDPCVRAPLGARSGVEDAWPEYFAVFAKVHALSQSDLVPLDEWWRRLCGRTTGGRPPSETGLRDLLDRWNADIDRLRAGAGAERAKFPVVWRDPGAFTRPLSGGRLAIRLLVLRASYARNAGRVSEALEDLAATLQIACDLARTPTLTGPDFGSEEAFATLFDWEEFVAGGAFSAEESRRLEQILLGCEKQIPALSAAFETHVAMRGVILALDAEHGAFPSADWPWWQRWPGRLNSERSAALLMLHFESAQEELRDIERIPWPQAAPRHAQLAFRKKDREGWWKSWNNTASSDLALRCWMARLRLLRCALLLRRGAGPEDPTWPIDPFKLRPIETRSEPDAVVVWCGSDDGDDVARGGLYRQQEGLPWDLEIRVRR